jgi:uncharacterized protein (DUF2384 family)
MYKYPQYPLLNRHLFALLGSHELVNRWYESPNRGFEDQRPIDILEFGDKQQVYKYVFNFCYG